MIFGQDRDQLLRGGMPDVCRSNLLRVGRPWRRRVTYAVVDGEAIDVSLARGHGRCLVLRRGAIEWAPLQLQMFGVDTGIDVIGLSGSGRGLSHGRGRLDNLRNCPLRSKAPLGQLDKLSAYAAPMWDNGRGLHDLAK